MTGGIHIYIEDHGALGPAAYPANVLRAFDPLLNAALVEISVEQADRWSTAEAAWTQAQEEMRSILNVRRSRMVAAVAVASDYQAANRAADRNRRGVRR